VTIEPDQPFAARILGEVNSRTRRTRRGAVANAAALTRACSSALSAIGPRDPVVVEYHSDMKRWPCRASVAGENHQSQRRSQDPQIPRSSNPRSSDPQILTFHYR
jgi:hypothetical protein